MKSNGHVNTVGDGKRRRGGDKTPLARALAALDRLDLADRDVAAWIAWRVAHARHPRAELILCLKHVRGSSR